MRKKKNISKVREKIGMVFQSYDLFPNMTILNNLLLAPMKVQKRNKEEVKRKRSSFLTGLVFWIRKIIIQDSSPVVRNSELPLYVPC